MTDAENHGCSVDMETDVVKRTKKQEHPTIDSLCFCNILVSLCYGVGARVAYINAIMGYYFLGLARRTKTLFALLYSLV